MPPPPHSHGLLEPVCNLTFMHMYACCESIEVASIHKATKEFGENGSENGARSTMNRKCAVAEHQESDTGLPWQESLCLQSSIDYACFVLCTIYLYTLLSSIMFDEHTASPPSLFFPEVGRKKAGITVRQYSIDNKRRKKHMHCS